jgi:hypothetical protein
MDDDDVSQMDSMRHGTANAEPNDADAARAPIDQRLTFQTELAHAMQIAAGRERDRIAAAVLDYAELEVDRTRARAAVESAELRRLAADDAERIRAWSEAEIDRIREEATRRTDERNVDLDTFLQRHHAMIETEVEAVAIAVRQYEAKLDQFFVDMTSSIDPAYIVRQADLIPHPPDLEIVRAAARADAVARFQERDESTTAEGTGALDDLPNSVGVGVMDPAAISSTSNIAERIEGQQGGPSGGGEAVGVGDPSGANPNPAVRLWRSVAALSAPSADSTGGQPGQPQ